MTDHEIVGQVLAGDTARFEALVDRYLPLVRGLCRSRVSNPAAHDDLIQETFIQGYVELHRLRDRSRFGPWLARIARNRCYTWVRNQGRRGRIEARLGGEAPRAVPSPEAEAIRQETVDWVHGAVARLPEKIRDAMALCYVEGLSTVEAARCLGIRESALRKRLQYGRQTIGEALFAGLEAKPVPPRDDRAQKARVLAALPLVKAPWLAGEAVAAGAGVAVAVKAAIGVVSLVAVAAAVSVATGGPSSWFGTPEESVIVVETVSSAPTVLPKAVAAAEESGGEAPAPDGPAGDVVLTVRYHIPGDAAAQVEAPLAADARLYVAPLRFDPEARGRLFAEAGVPAEIVRAMEELRKSRLEGVGAVRAAMAEAGLTQEDMQAATQKLDAYLSSLGREEAGMRLRDMAPHPVWTQARPVQTDLAGRVEVEALGAGEYALSMSPQGDEDTPREPLPWQTFVVHPGERVEKNVYVLDPVSAIRGTVTAGGSGDPIANATVSLEGIPLAFDGFTVSSKPGGEFEFPAMMVGFGPFTLRATVGSHEPVVLKGERRPGVPTLLDLRLDRPRAVVSGRILNADGTPAPGVSVMRVMSADGGAQGAGTSDAEGRYAVPHDGGVFDLYAMQGTVKTEKAAFDLKVDESASQDFVLPPHARVLFDIRTPDGAPLKSVEQALIMAEFTDWVQPPYGKDGPLMVQRHSSQETQLAKAPDEPSLFVLSYLGPGQYEVRLYCKGYEGETPSFQIPAEPEEQRVTVRLRPQRTVVRVRVVDDTGRPVPGAGYELWWGQFFRSSDGSVSGGAWSGFDRLTVDDSGEALLRGLPPGDYKIGDDAMFSAPTTETVVVQRAAPRAEEFRGEPVVTVTREMIRPLDEKGNEIPMMSEWLKLYCVSASGMGDDSYSAHLGVGSYTLYVVKSGYTPAVVKLDLSQEEYEARLQNSLEPRSIDAVFGRGGALTGYATDDAGRPLANRELAVLPVELQSVAEADWDRHRTYWQEFVRMLAQGARTGDDGSFRIEHLPPGRYLVGLADGSLERAVARGAFEVRADPETGSVAIVEEE